MFFIKIHGAIAVTAITPLLNLNLNYEKLHVKYTNSFNENNNLKRFFMLFLFTLGKNIRISASDMQKSNGFKRESLCFPNRFDKIPDDVLRLDTWPQTQNQQAGS